ncbi:MAG: RNA polymerase sigma-70 factor [Bacteroidales bacterium]|jgi:RNA polymerase sigma-70 factor (ECF subfamily)|nr:RNA polymerase sigma-70 factor [Bacteroidales bacterium]
MNLETDIVKGLKSGCDTAYRHLYEHYYKLLCTVAFEYVGDAFVSEMIVSDVIFAIWQSRESIEINISLRNYLIKSVRNRCLNYLAHSERQHVLRNHVGKKIETEQANDTNNPDNPLTQLIEKELDRKINESIEALPEQTRRIFCLSRFNDMKYEEIARETGVSVDVVKYHIKSALVRLRAALKDYLTVLLILLSVLQ